MMSFRRRLRHAGVEVACAETTREEWQWSIWLAGYQAVSSCQAGEQMRG